MPIEVKAKTKAVTFALGDEARVNVGIKGAKGDKGDAFTYDDFTPEQLEALKGKDGYTPVKGVDYFDGEKGDAFTYEDFTPEQLAALKGEKGDAFTFEDFTQEQLTSLKGEKGDTGYGASLAQDVYCNKSPVSNFFEAPEDLQTNLDIIDEALSDFNVRINGMKDSIPKKVSDLENDAGYITEASAGGAVGEAQTTIDIKSIIIPNQYYSSSGVLVGYTGWDASQLFDVSEYDSIGINNWSNGAYNCFFDKDKKFISAVSFPGKVEVPDNAVYLAVSAASSYYNNAVVIGYKESRYATYAELTQVVYRVDNLEEEVGNSSLLLSLI